jgi:hypothetical protein
MGSLDDIFGGLAGIAPHIGDPDHQHMPSIPFPCAEDAIEHHEHGPNMSINASFEADKDLQNPKRRSTGTPRRRGARFTKEEIKARSTRTIQTTTHHHKPFSQPKWEIRNFSQNCSYTRFEFDRYTTNIFQIALCLKYVK